MTMDSRISVTRLADVGTLFFILFFPPFVSLSSRFYNYLKENHSPFFHFLSSALLITKIRRIIQQNPFLLWILD